MSDDLRYCVEYARSNRSGCQKCKKLINQESLRLATIVQSPYYDGKISRWYHYECFFLEEEPKSTDDIAYFDQIRYDDQVKIRKKIEERFNTSPSSGARRKRTNAAINGEDGEEVHLKKVEKEPEDIEEENLLKKQNEELYSIREQISKLKRNELIEILNENNQISPKGKPNILDLLADILYFGALKACPECCGQLIYTSGLGYKCASNMSEWSKCEYVTQYPARKKCTIPSKLKEDFPIKSYKSKIKKRIFKVTSPSSSSSVKKEDTTDGQKMHGKSDPSENMQFEQSSPRKIKLQIKNGGIVDPDSCLEKCSHIYQDENNKYTTTLGLANIQTNQNKYYIMQILEDDEEEKYYLFRSWGRIGTDIGNQKLESMSLEECIKQFKELFKNKTGNLWENRDHFVKVPNLMYPIDIDCEKEKIVSLDSQSDIKSNLPKPILDLMHLIFNIANMKSLILEFEIDMDKMPLGKLSKKQIEEASDVLTELIDILKKNDIDRTTLIDASNRFYTLIPHNFGISGPKILESLEEIKGKRDMLDALRGIEIAYNLLQFDKTKEKQNPFDTYYEQLNTDIELLDKMSDEFKMIQKYVENTHTETHTEYELEIEDVFVIKRHGEAQRYKPFEQLPNKKLLWHGSRITNFAGILSQGLRIAPPEAQITGDMFGKGIYFADRVSKSAFYCWTDIVDPTGLVLLCEVALGNMYERYLKDNIKKLPEGKHSTLGRGKTKPDPEDIHIMEGGVEVPYGTGVPANDKSAKLLYNEYIIYNVDQVKLKYLLKLNFKYKI